MKYGIMLALLSFVGVPAFAATQQICGDLSSYEFGPTCTPGEACPQWMALGYELTLDGGTVTKLSADDESVLTSFGQDKGKMVCVDGAYVTGSRASFDVASVITDFATPLNASVNTAVSTGSWVDGSTSLKISGDSATIQFVCGYITVAAWHADGSAMDGMDHPGPVIEGPGTPISVTATPTSEGRLHVTVGQKGTRSQYVFTPGAPTITGLRCL